MESQKATKQDMNIMMVLPHFMPLCQPSCGYVVLVIHAFGYNAKLIVSLLTVQCGLTVEEMYISLFMYIVERGRQSDIVVTVFPTL